MIQKLKYYLFIIGLACSGCLSAQEKNRECLETLLEIEQLNNNLDSVCKSSTVFLNYTVRVIDWEDQTTNSNVKVYRNNKHTHLLSEQANMYNDSKEVLLVLPSQKVIVINSIDPKMKELSNNQQSFRLRKSFLDSCEVVKCEEKDSSNHVLVLKGKPGKVSTDIKITRLVYEYNVSQKKINRITTDYSKDYKIKQMTVVFKAVNTNCQYTFLPAKSYAMNNKGEILGRYNDFELIDNRDNTIANNNGNKKH